MPFSPKIGKIAIDNTIIPIPPIHWVSERQNSSPCVMTFRSGIMVAPVVASPLTTKVLLIKFAKSFPSVMSQLTSLAFAPSLTVALKVKEFPLTTVVEPSAEIVISVIGHRDTELKHINVVSDLG